MTPGASLGSPSSLDLLTAAIDRALDDEEFTLAFQPKISLTTNRIIGFEALIRWVMPNGDIVAPVDFIPVAEASGHILRIGEWVLGHACRQLAAWQRAFPAMTLTMAINVSPRQFGPRLIAALGSILKHTGVAASDVWLELTETTVMDDVESSLVVLEGLRELGVNISLDDFGTGHSSLAHLRRLPIDELKIDRSFVSGLGANAVDTAIVASVINLAHAMRCHVTAEGVETASQLDRLRNLGCDSVQGYLLARPQAPAEIRHYLAADLAGQRWPRRSVASDVEPSVIAQRVLIVDDAGEIRTMAAMALSAAGFVTHEAASPGEAIAIARRIRPDYIVIDMNTSRMSSIDLCRMMRADTSLRDCTIMIVSGAAASTAKAKAFLSGADDYVVKPFAPRDLVTRLHAATRGSRDATVDESAVNPPLTLLASPAAAHAIRDTDLTITLEGHFSERQLEIIERLIKGERVPTIARGLYLSQSTVRNHLSAVFRKLGVHSQEQLIATLRKGA
jgi:EAL domain-containing protein (putative c-di-GMP-specific phosphodiesterase class I)/DNA-binding NarL/FixJ family response regulator